MSEMQGAEPEAEGSIHRYMTEAAVAKATQQIAHYETPQEYISTPRPRRLRMSEMQGAEPEAEGSVHRYMTEAAVAKATQQIAHYETPQEHIYQQ